MVRVCLRISQLALSDLIDYSVSRSDVHLLYSQAATVMYCVMIELTFSKVVVSITLKRQPGKKLIIRHLGRREIRRKLGTPRPTRTLSIS